MPTYPADEFDDAAEHHGPAGVHRHPRSALRAILITVAVFVGAGLLAYGAVIYMWRADGGTGLPPIGEVTAPTNTEFVVVTPSGESPSVSTSPSASEAPPTSQAPAEVPVNFGASVTVLNGAQIGGLAARESEKLVAGGFTTVTASNITANLPAANTVRYSDAAFESTARKVAEILGIAAVEMGVTPEGNISVILVTDPSA